MPPTALVTECSSGIGRATVESFLDDGWSVYATTRDPGLVEAFDAEGATVAELDVTSDDDVDRVVARAVSETGRLDCLVNNAGYGQFGPLEDVSTADLEDQFDVNVFGPHRLVREALPRLREGDGGTLVNVGSVAAGSRWPASGRTPVRSARSRG